MPAFITRRTTRAVALAALVAIGSAACQATRRDDRPRPQHRHRGERDANREGNRRARRRSGDCGDDPEPPGSPRSARRQSAASIPATAAGSARRGSHRAGRRDDIGKCSPTFTAAESAHDAMARAAFRAELRALCSPTSLTSAIEPCDGAGRGVGAEAIGPRSRPSARCGERPGSMIGR